MTEQRQSEVENSNAMMTKSAGTHSLLSHGNCCARPSHDGPSSGVLPSVAMHGWADLLVVQKSSACYRAHSSALVASLLKKKAWPDAAPRGPSFKYTNRKCACITVHEKGGSARLQLEMRPE